MLELELSKENAIKAYRNALNYYREKYPDDTIGNSLAFIWDDIDIKDLT